MQNRKKGTLLRLVSLMGALLSLGFGTYVVSAAFDIRSTTLTPPAKATPCASPLSLTALETLAVKSQLLGTILSSNTKHRTTQLINGCD
jgi:hypothetical protein